MTVLVVVERTPDGDPRPLAPGGRVRAQATPRTSRCMRSSSGRATGSRESSASTASRPCTSPSTTRSRPTPLPPSPARRSTSMGRTAASAVVAAGNERGNEVLAHVAAIADLPFAANCIEATAGDPALVTRIRWGGSLLEEARLHGTPALMTVQPHTVAPEAVGGGARRRRALLARARRGRPRRARPRARRRGDGRRLARGREGRRLVRPRRRLAGGVRDHRGARRPARRGGRLLARRDDGGLETAHRSGRADRDEDRPRHLHRVRHLRRHAAHGRLQGREGDPRRQHRSRGADPRERRLRGDRRPPRGRPGDLGRAQEGDRG